MLLFAIIFSNEVLMTHVYADFYQPLKEDELEQSTVVPIIFEMDPKPVRFSDLRKL